LVYFSKNRKGKRLVTWKTLTEVLQNSDLSVLAGEVEDVNTH